MFYGLEILKSYLFFYNDDEYQKYKKYHSKY